MHLLITFVAKYCVAIPVLVVLYVFLKLSKRQRLTFVVLLITSTVFALILVKIATTLRSDPRPFVRDGVIPYFKSSVDNGFPSDHTTFSALIGFAVVLYSRKLGIGLLILSLFIGSARVIAGVHHGQDIVGGFIIAAVSVALSMYVTKIIGRRIQKNKQPSHT